MHESCPNENMNRSVPLVRVFGRVSGPDKIACDSRSESFLITCDTQLISYPTI